MGNSVPVTLGQWLTDWRDAGLEDMPPPRRNPLAERVSTHSAILDSPESLAESIASCTLCPRAENRTSVVVGAGPSPSELMILEESPGRAESESGTAFGGPGGQLLDKMLTPMGTDRSRVWIGSILRCAGSVPASPDDADSCLPWLKRQVVLVNPRVLVVFGPLALSALGLEGDFSSLQGRWTEWNGVAVMPLDHPSALLRDPALKRQAWAGLQKVMDRAYDLRRVPPELFRNPVAGVLRKLLKHDFNFFTVTPVFQGLMGKFSDLHSK